MRHITPSPLPLIRTARCCGWWGKQGAHCNTFVVIRPFLGSTFWWEKCTVGIDCGPDGTFWPCRQTMQLCPSIAENTPGLISSGVHVPWILQGLPSVSLEATPMSMGWVAVYCLLGTVYCLNITVLSFILSGQPSQPRTEFTHQPLPNFRACSVFELNISHG